MSVICRDIRQGPLFREAERLCESLRRPGRGEISDATDVQVDSAGKQALFTGSILETLTTAPITQIFSVDLASGDVRPLTAGPNSDRHPRYSPDGRLVAFLSDRRKKGQFQLYLQEVDSLSVHSTPAIQGMVEYLHWSPDGKRIVLSIAGFGSDRASVEGAVTIERPAEDQPSWLPTVEVKQEDGGKRSLWIYELESNQAREIKSPYNTWEAAWCGNQALVALMSPGSSEASWYGAKLHTVQVDNGTTREIYSPGHQVGCVSGHPSGRCVACVEATCSDRGEIGRAHV